MKKIFGNFLLCALLCAALLLTTSAITPSDYGYYDQNLDGKVEIIDTLTILKELLQGTGEEVNLLRVLRVLKASASNETVAATVLSVDAAAGTAVVSTEDIVRLTVPLSVLGLDENCDAAALDCAKLTLAVQTPFSASSKVYGVVMGTHPEIAEGTNAKPISIEALNLNSTNGSHANDDIATASLERNFREDVVLNSALTSYARYDKAWYPRVKQVKDDLYILFWMYGQFGRHLYYATSADGQNWNAPRLLWGANDSKKFTHTYGPLVGTESAEDIIIAVNADACVLENGDILCVYALRPEHGYSYTEYMDMSGIFMMRGTVSADNTIVWGSEVQLTAGQVWEPFIWQRPDGQIEVYWSNAAPYISIYGFDTEKRSTGTSMILSADGGYTWSPSIEEGKAGGYLYNRVYQEFVGNKIPDSAYAPEGVTYTEAVPYFGGQMPSVTQLYNGKSLIAVEVHEYETGDSYYISLATSEDGGTWKNLGLLETATASMTEYTKTASIAERKGAAPYLARFPSGEVYLTYNKNSQQHGRLLTADGQNIDSEIYYPTPNAKSSWGATEIVGSHKVLSTFPDAGVADAEGNKKRAIHITSSYLNHRIDAHKFAVDVDGYTNDWDLNTDALFVGSESQAQLSVQVAYDKDNMYFLLSRMDAMLNNGDSVSLYVNKACINVALDGSYTVGSVSGSGVANVYGTVGDNTDTDEGVLIELSIPRTALGLANATSFAILPVLTNVDDGEAITDTLTNVTLDTTARWPSVVLD